MVFTLLAVATQVTISVLLQQLLPSQVVLSAHRPLLLPRFTPVYHRSLYRSAASDAASSAATTTYSDTTTALTRAAACRFVTVVLNPAATAGTALPQILARGGYRRRRLHR